MPKLASRYPGRIDQFFSGPGARADQWRNLVELAEAWVNDSDSRTEVLAAFAEMAPAEDFHAYPGRHLMTVLRTHILHDKALAMAELARHITRALLTRSYRQLTRDDEDAVPRDDDVVDVMPPSMGRSEAHRPYFEVLIVTGAPAPHWVALAAEWRRLRRPLDTFVYEPVIVGSFEDAFCAAMLNPDLAAVVIHEGFPFRSEHDAPVLRTLSEAIAPEAQKSAEESALRLAQLLKRVRPELDLYFVANGIVEEIAGACWS